MKVVLMLDEDTGEATRVLAALTQAEWSLASQSRPSKQTKIEIRSYHELADSIREQIRDALLPAFGGSE